MTEEERYAKVEADRQAAINQSNQTYNDLLASNSQLAQQQKDYVNTWQTTQNEIADKNAAYQTELQNQNKQKAQKEFQNEAIASKNAYYDFINPYGAQAEIQAQNGLNNTGYSETTRSGAWNTQQNRTAQARSTMNNAIQQYDNAIKEIELNRDTTKAEYALQALQQQLDVALQEYNNNSQLKQNQLSNNQALDSEYNTRYDTLWNQINTEKQQEEAIRQYNQNYAFQEQQYQENIRQYEQNYALQQQQYQEDIRQFDENIAYLKAKDEKEYQLQIQQLEEAKRQAEIEQANWEKEYQLSLQQLELDRYSTYNSSRSRGSSSTKYANGVVSYGTLANSYGDGSGNMIYTDTSGNTYKMKEGYNPYTGTKNNDVANGTFSNGYQPNNVSGNRLSQSGKKVEYNGQNQNVWACTNGSYYIWDGTQNKYLKLNNAEKNALGL